MNPATGNASLLIEIGTEELPPKSLDALAAAFAAGVIDGLAANGVSMHDAGARIFASPRRLAVLVPGVAALQPDQWSGGVLVENRDDPLAREIMALSRWIDDQRKGGQRFSDVDRKKRLRTILQSALPRSRAEMSGMKPDGFAWFHRQVAEETAKDRELIDKAFLESAEAMR